MKFICFCPTLFVAAGLIAGNPTKSEWPGANVTEKIALLKAICPRRTVHAVWEYCMGETQKRQAELHDAERDEHQHQIRHFFTGHNEFYKKMDKKLFARSYSEVDRKYIQPFVVCVDHCNKLKQKWTLTIAMLEEHEERAQKGGEHHQMDQHQQLDGLLAQLNNTINNETEAFNELLEVNEAFAGVFGIPPEHLVQLEMLRNFDLREKMRDMMSIIQNWPKRSVEGTAPHEGAQ